MEARLQLNYLSEIEKNYRLIYFPFSHGIRPKELQELVFIEVKTQFLRFFWYKSLSLPSSLPVIHAALRGSKPLYDCF